VKEFTMMATTAQLRDLQILRDRPNNRAGETAFWSVSILAFALSWMATIVWCSSMPKTSGMTMPGGWTMSMAWMRMRGQTWLIAAVSFLGMWAVMMLGMMLPSLVPMLRRYRNAVSAGEPRLGQLTAVVGAGYFFVWIAIGIAVFAAGAALASAEMRQAAIARAVPFATAAVVSLAGAAQFTAWKASRLACCRASHVHGGVLPPGFGTAWRHGLRIGVDCAYCCGVLTLALVVIGVMDLRAMAAAAAVISAERLLPGGERVARTVGYLVLGQGLLLIAQAARLA
jgi:predicted metal-binding membrane protein